jgi:GH15 family glucan-1,4-alpha-glucosidase/ferredoxin
MPRDIPIGNGRLLINFDERYRIRDVYFPHVGQENHAGGQPFQFGVFVESSTPDPSTPRTSAGPVPGKLYWTTDPGWKTGLRYLRDTLTTSVSLEHPQAGIDLYCNDTVDFHRNVYVRRIKVRNHHNSPKRVRVIQHQDFALYGTKLGDTASYDPNLTSLVHYRSKRYLSVTFVHEGRQRIDEFATGTSGFGGAEGTWRDAEDGHLQGNAIAQGAVDSTAMIVLDVPAHGEQVCYLVMIAGESRDEIIAMHEWLKRHPPQTVIDRTNAYWRLWVGGTNINFGNLPASVVDLFKRSLLIVRTQIDNNGAIVAANDSDIVMFSRDTYSYVWPRDGGLVADALDLAGFPDLARSFYTFCQKTITREGYFLHKYNPDGSPASSWHPWLRDGKPSLPIQEDETALVVWALWRHYFRYRDIEFMRPLWVDVVQPAADFMARYRDPTSGLPMPSYDLWEERWGVHAFTVATVYGGLKAAHNFAVAFGDRERARRYKQAAEEVKAGAARHLWSDKLGRFARRIVPKVCPSCDASGDVASQYGDALPPPTEYEIDDICDASLFSIFKFHLFEADDPRVIATMDAVKDKLWCKTEVGGLARYERDYYHRVSEDFDNVPGNPWFICTLWLADYLITRARTPEELKLALPIFEWTADHALESGVLAEQVNPFTNAPMSVSPLTWSHATVVSTAVKYLEKLQTLFTDQTGRPIFQVRRPGPVDVSGHAVFSRDFADFDPNHERETAAASGKFVTTDPTGRSVMANLSINTVDCIGCGMCVAKCPQKVLRQVDGKAMIDLTNLDRCDINGECVRTCPTQVVKIEARPVEG